MKNPHLSEGIGITQRGAVPHSITRLSPADYAIHCYLLYNAEGQLKVLLCRTYALLIRSDEAT